MKRTAYHREDWIGQQIEAYQRAPSAGMTSGRCFSDELLHRAELNRLSPPPLFDVDQVNRTTYALDHMPLDQRVALLLYHTKRTLTLRDMARSLKISKDAMRHRLTLAHWAFADAWTAAKFKAIINDLNRPKAAPVLGLA